MTVAGITEQHGALILGTQQNNGTVSITNGDHLTKCEKTRILAGGVQNRA